MAFPRSWSSQTAYVVAQELPASTHTFFWSKEGRVSPDSVREGTVQAPLGAGGEAPDADGQLVFEQVLGWGQRERLKKWAEVRSLWSHRPGEVSRLSQEQCANIKRLPDIQTWRF